jgi:hypothetical protein
MSNLFKKENKMKKKEKRFDGYMGLNIEQDIKKRFIAVCEENDTSASQELRKFIKDYLMKHSQKKMNFK